MAPETISLLSVGVATLASTTLLGLAAACLQSAAGDAARARQPLDAVAVLLLSLALWWPLHLGSGQMLLVRGGQVPAAAAALAPLLMAGLAWLVHRGWRAGQKPATAAAASGLLLLVWAVLEADPPATPAVPALAPALLAPLLTALLLGSLLLAGTGRWMTSARSLATLGAAALLN